MQYSKILVARYSPENGCNVSDGVVLFVVPRDKVPLKSNVVHYFTGTVDNKTQSKYGWVKRVEPFTIDEFAMSNLHRAIATEKERLHLETMFRSIERLEDGTTVAATYSSRGVETKLMEFTVHRVFFYDA